MKLFDKISADLVAAMKTKDILIVKVLRALKSEIGNACIRNKTVLAEVPDTEVISIIRKTISKHDDSAAQFSAAGRLVLAGEEILERAVLQNYLPAEMSDETLDELVTKTIEELQATSKKDMGRVIKKCLTLTDGTASPAKVSKLVGEKLN